MDTDEWIEAYRTLERPVYNVVYRWLWSAEDAQDIVQEAFMKAWKMNADIRQDGFKALIFRIALNLVRNRKRRQAIWSFVTLEQLRAPTTDPTLSSLEETQVRHALSSLPEQHRSVLLLTEFAGLSHKELATVLGVQPGTIGSRRHRALAHLKQLLNAQGLDYEDH